MIQETVTLIPLIESKDYGSVGIDTDSVNTGRLHSLIAVFTFGAITGNSVLKVYSGATAGTKTTAETFRYRLADAEQGVDDADNFGDWATSAALTLTCRPCLRPRTSARSSRSPTTTCAIRVSQPTTRATSAAPCISVSGRKRCPLP